jgi:membrane-associated phospholipid phosphatase
MERKLFDKALFRRPVSTVVTMFVLAAGSIGTVQGKDAVEASGDLLRLAIPAWALVRTFRQDDRAGRRQFLKSFGANVVATWALKEAVDEERPDGSGNDAFPSGHASMAFQGAAFVHRRYGFKAALPGYALATYVGWTRIDSNQHDEADVVAGAALGIASSWWLTRRMQGVDVATILGPDTIGISIAGRF